MESNQNKASEDAIFIDLGELLFILRKRLPIILAVTILLGALGFVRSYYFTTPMYESSTSMYVLTNTNGENTNVTSGDFSLSTQISTDLSAMVKSRMVLEKVIEELGLTMDYDTLKSEITVSSSSNSTRIVTIYVKDRIPQRAQLIADTVRDISSEHIKDVMHMDAVSVVDYAYLPTEMCDRYVKSTTFKYAFVGFILMCAIFILSYILNDTITTSEDAERRLGISCLASIPKDKNFKKEKQGRGNR